MIKVSGRIIIEHVYGLIGLQERDQRGPSQDQGQGLDPSARKPFHRAVGTGHTLGTGGASRPKPGRSNTEVQGRGRGRGHLRRKPSVVVGRGGRFLEAVAEVFQGQSLEAGPGLLSKDGLEGIGHLPKRGHGLP